MQSARTAAVAEISEQLPPASAIAFISARPLASALVNIAPEQAMAAAGLLGNGFATADTYYIHGTSKIASGVQNALVAGLRAGFRNEQAEAPSKSKGRTGCAPPSTPGIRATSTGRVDRGPGSPLRGTHTLFGIRLLLESSESTFWTLVVHAERNTDFERYRLYYVYLNERKEGVPGPGRPQSYDLMGGVGAERERFTRRRC
jgi:hypothetical protein